MKPVRHYTTRPDRHPRRGGWERVARWYDGMVGNSGSRTHQNTALAGILSLLPLKKGDTVLDIGCGQGVLAPRIFERGGQYVGIDSSKTMIAQAQSRHSRKGTFIVADAMRLASNKAVATKGPFDACTFLLSIQDIPDAERAISQAALLLKINGIMVIFMTHPAFRIPRQSGWGFDSQRKLVYRRVDSYLSQLDVPMRTHHTTNKILTRSYHRPIGYYINALANSSISISKMEEISVTDDEREFDEKSERRAHAEIPLFLALQGRKLSRQFTS